MHVVQRARSRLSKSTYPPFAYLGQWPANIVACHERKPCTTGWLSRSFGRHLSRRGVASRKTTSCFLRMVAPHSADGRAGRKGLLFVAWVVLIELFLQITKVRKSHPLIVIPVTGCF